MTTTILLSSSLPSHRQRMLLLTSLFFLVMMLRMPIIMISAFSSTTSTAAAGSSTSGGQSRHRRRQDVDENLAAKTRNDDPTMFFVPEEEEDDSFSSSFNHHSSIRRRSLVSQLANGIILTTTLSFSSSHLTTPPPAASAAIEITTTTNNNNNNNDTLEKVYFGAGCFWHVQHEMIMAERTLLHRKDTELTSVTGYAGGGGGTKSTTTNTLGQEGRSRGSGTDEEGRVCYHNLYSIADYGKLGHGEVVGITIPTESVGEFAEEYFKLFNSKGERADPMDKGGEYRSLLGLPGGRKHPMFHQVDVAASKHGMILVDGRGDDPDTLGKRVVYVMDSNDFPFYQAEVYHQYHNDFLTPAYGKQYNDLVNAALEDGRIKITGCPDRV